MRKLEFTKSDRKKMYSALRRVAKGGVVTEDERPMFEKLSWSLDRPRPSHACTFCWFQRVIEGKE